MVLPCTSAYVSKYNTAPKVETSVTGGYRYLSLLFHISGSTGSEYHRLPLQSLTRNKYECAARTLFPAQCKAERQPGSLHSGGKSYPQFVIQVSPTNMCTAANNSPPRPPLENKNITLTPATTVQCGVHFSCLLRATGTLK